MPWVVACPEREIDVPGEAHEAGASATGRTGLPQFLFVFNRQDCHLGGVRGAAPVAFDTEPQDIADTIFWVLNTPAHININRLELMPVTQSWSGFAIERHAKE